MSTQDIGQYSASIKQNGLRLNANEPLVVGGTATFNGVATFMAGTSTAVQVLASAATIAVPTTTGSLFSHTPTQNETLNAATVVAGQSLRFVITTSGTTSFTLTFGTNFKSTGTLATGTVSGKVFVIEFVSDGVNYNELARSTAE